MLKKIIISSTFSFFLNHCFAQNLKLVFVGDAMAHKQLQQDMAKLPNGFGALMQNIKQPISQADLAHVNVETTVGVPKTDSEKDKAAALLAWSLNTPYSGFPYFNVHPQYLDALKEVGFDVFQLSNNHSLDRKARGVDITQEQLKSKSMLGYGTLRKDSQEYPSVRVPVVKSGKTFYVAYVSCSFSTNGNPDYEKRVPLCFESNSEAVLNEIYRQKHVMHSDIVVFTPHWGDEYSRNANKQQIDLAHRAVKAGADAIVGTHPHVLQEYKTIDTSEGRTVPIFYSLGNFFNWSINKEGTTSSVIAQLEYELKNNAFIFKSASAIPIAANNKRYPLQHQRALFFVEKDQPIWSGELSSIQKSIDKQILVFGK